MCSTDLWRRSLYYSNPVRVGTLLTTTYNGGFFGPDFTTTEISSRFAHVRYTHNRCCSRYLYCTLSRYLLRLLHTFSLFFFFSSSTTIPSCRRLRRVVRLYNIIVISLARCRNNDNDQQLQ